jgi:hypothetical protein
MYGRPIRAFGTEIDGRVHTLRIDRDDNVWAVIEETNTILKFNAQGRLLMRLFPPPDPPDGVVDDPPSEPPSASPRVPIQPPDERVVGKSIRRNRSRCETTWLSGSQIPQSERREDKGDAPEPPERPECPDEEEPSRGLGDLAVTTSAVFEDSAFDIPRTMSSVM